MNDDNEEVRCPCCGRAVSKAQLRSSIEQMNDERWRLVEEKRSATDEERYQEITDLIDWYDAVIWTMDLIIDHTGTEKEGV